MIRGKNGEKMNKLICLACLILFSISGLSFAEVIVLDSGEKIEANVIRRDDKTVIVDYKGTTIAYYTFEIKSIDGEPLKPSKKDVHPQDVSEEGAGIAQVDVVSAEE